MRVGIAGGTGWLGFALGRRLLDDRIVAPSDLTILNRSGPRADYAGYRVGWAADPKDLVQRSDIIILSIRPETWRTFDLDASGKLVLSFMAGIDCADLARCKGRIVRAVPNAAAEIGASYSPWYAGPGITDADKSAVTRILSSVGTSDELEDEKQVDVMTALPGSGAAYPALMAVAMFEYAKSQDVPPDIAWRAAEGAICGGAALLSGRISNAPALLAAYHDYRGTTAAGLCAAQESGFDASITNALSAATRKARDMSFRNQSDD
ncbi:pyrroline-5-carboxylate reductase family protein [Falsirhodobacter xinxiangensis]|uniref:pyrroline-5-carboxylate reductase family protein n=1 Tax=Falsirhodobacter xinxiangensis TaxID=2530049 RepID=UPI0010AB4EAF|nr:pyrroline-5-carboxylate reductase dimerization domain-containing protein [Rhodobacter xinxiangensis]